VFKNIYTGISPLYYAVTIHSKHKAVGKCTCRMMYNLQVETKAVQVRERYYKTSISYSHLLSYKINAANTIIIVCCTVKYI